MISDIVFLIDFFVMMLCGFSLCFIVLISMCVDLVVELIFFWLGFVIVDEYSSDILSVLNDEFIVFVVYMLLYEFDVGYVFFLMFLKFFCDIWFVVNLLMVLNDDMIVRLWFF